MATSTYALAVNYDGSQHTAYKAGDKPGNMLAPDSLTISNPTETTLDITWNYSSSGHNGFELARWIAGSSDRWTIIATPAAGERFYQDSNLPSGTHIGYRIRATDEL